MFKESFEERCEREIKELLFEEKVNRIQKKADLVIDLIKHTKLFIEVLELHAHNRKLIFNYNYKKPSVRFTEKHVPNSKKTPEFKRFILNELDKLIDFNYIDSVLNYEDHYKYNIKKDISNELFNTTKSKYLNQKKRINKHSQRDICPIDTW